MENKPNDNKNDGNKNKPDVVKEENYVYFMTPYEDSKEYETYLSQEYKGFETLETIDELCEEKSNYNIKIKVYRFKIIPEYMKKVDGKEYQIPVFMEEKNPTKDQIPVIMEEKNQTKHQYIIKLKNIKKNYYEYNFIIEEIDVLPMKYEKQFEIYIDILKKKYKKKQKDKEYLDFITLSQSLLTGKDKKFDFAFYLLIFLECFSTNLIKNHLVLFKPNKISGIGEFNAKKLKPIGNILNTISKKPEQIHIEKEEDRQKATEIFYTIYLYFCIHFQPDQVIEIFKNEKQFDFLYEQLIIFNNLFDNLTVPKEIVIKLIDRAKEYKHILNFLSFLGKDCVLFLRVLNEKKELIKKLFEKAKEEKNKNEKDNKAQDNNAQDKKDEKNEKDNTDNKDEKKRRN